ncbi:MAG: hypothetical protein KF847_09510 [Pirellulales bacterium]|nr:hypothetical protein [Pirellulales bacterium]
MAFVNRDDRTSPSALPRPVRRRICWALAVLSAATGCRGVNTAQLDLLERELRQQEDYIYELEDNLLTYSEKLRECRCANPNAATNGTKKSPPSKRPLPEPTLAEDAPAPRANAKAATPAPTPRPRTTPTDPAPTAPEFELPETELPDAAPEELDAPAEELLPENFSPEELEAPELEIGPTSDARPLETAPSYAATPGDEPEGFGDLALVLPDPAADDLPPEDGSALLAAEDAALVRAPDALQLTAANPEEESPLVAGAPVQLVVRHLLRDDAGSDGAEPQSLYVVVEAVDIHGRPATAIEATSIMLLREDAPGSFESIRRWDFSQEEAATAWQESALGAGLHFELPLRGAQLPAGPVQAWARIVQEDGTKLLAKAVVDAGALASLDEALAAAPTRTVDAEPIARPIPTGRPARRRDAQTKSAAATTDGPTWRKAATPIGPLSQGFATTAPGGWSTGPVATPADVPSGVRPASATEPAGSNSWRGRAAATR